MKHFICATKNGLAVTVDLIHSQAAAHIAQDPRILELVYEALRQTTAHGSELRLELDMGRAIGYDYVVETSQSDTIIYAQLLRNKLYTRFVKNGKPKPTQHLSMCLKDDGEKGYELLNAWIGRQTPPRPGSRHETTASRSYWQEHAFVLDRQPVQSRTVTKVCPY